MTDLRPILVVDDSAKDVRGVFVARPAPLPIVMLLDLKMPKVDGLEVLRCLRYGDAHTAMEIQPRLIFLRGIFPVFLDGFFSGIAFRPRWTIR